MITKQVGVMIATPLRSYKGVEDLPKQIGATIRALHDHAKVYKWEFVAACGGIAHARNNTVHEFLKTEYPWLLWWDSDLHCVDQMGSGVGASVNAVLRLLGHRQPIVGGMYCKRVQKPVWVANFMPSAKLQKKGEGLLQVAELGTGFKLIHRKVFTEIARIFDKEPRARKEPSIGYKDRETGEWITGFYQQVVQDGDFLTEDYFFDYLCRSAQIPIMADTKVRLVHEDDGKSFPVDGKWPPIPAEVER